MVWVSAALLPYLPRPLAILRQAWDAATFQRLWPSGTQTLIHRWHSPETICMKAPPWLFFDLSGQSLEEAPSWGVLHVQTVGDVGVGALGK